MVVNGFALSGDVLVSAILMQHFDIKWIFTCGRLVCSDWNQAIISSPLSIRIYLGNKERIDQFMESGVSGLFKSLDRIAIGGLDIDAMHLSLLPKDLSKFNGQNKKVGLLTHWWNYGVEILKSFSKLSFEDVHLLSLFDGISGLEMNGIADEGVEYLIKHEKLLELKELCLSADKTKISQRITKLGISTLTSLKFNNLKSLDLRNNMLGVAGLSQLFKSQSFPHLTSLSLRECHNFEKRIDEAFKFFESKKFYSLTHLDLGICKIGDDAMRYIFLQKWESLKNVNLYNNYIGVDGCKYIAQSPTETIEYLELSHQSKGIDEFGCLELSKIQSFKLKHLNLEKNRIAKGIEHLCNSTRMEHIETLIINNCCLSYSACEIIVNSVFKSNLTFLDVSGGNLYLESLFCGSLTNLKKLKASGKNYTITNRKIPTLKSDALPSIQSIDLSYNSLTYEFLNWLSASFNNLDYLNVRATCLTDEGVILLTKTKIKNIDISENRLELFNDNILVNKK